MFVDRNEQGQIVALYANPQIEGHEWVENAELWTPEPDPKAETKAQIDQLLEMAGVSQGWHLDAMMAGMVALASTQGITEAQLYEVNPGYKQVKDVSEQIKYLLAQL